MQGVHTGADEALLEFAAKTEDRRVATSASFGLACLRDASLLLADAGTVALALSAAEQLCADAARLQRHGGADLAQPAAGQPGSGQQVGGDEATGGDRQRLLLAKRKLRFMGAWLAALEHSERQAALAGLQFALRREVQRRDEMLAAARTPSSAASAPLQHATKAPSSVSGRRLMQELQGGDLPSGAAQSAATYTTSESID
eukprot:6759654-Prymnesium_polylepis.1